MSIGFFIIGGIIFAFYIYFTIWNIFHSSKEQRKENYPTIIREEQSKLEKQVENFFTKNKSA